MLLVLLPSLAVLSCKKELNVGNPNQPTLALNVTTETGLIAFTLGGVYSNGIGNGSLGWLGNSYASLPYGFSELLGDMVSAEAANQIVNIVNIPDSYKLTPGGASEANDAPMRTVIRTNNTRPSTAQGNNVFYYHWVANYSLNNACNTILSLVDAVSYTGNATVKKRIPSGHFVIFGKDGPMLI